MIFCVVLQMREMEYYRVCSRKTIDDDDVYRSYNRSRSATFYRLPIRYTHLFFEIFVVLLFVLLFCKNTTQNQTITITATITQQIPGTQVHSPTPPLAKPGGNN